MKKGVSVWGNVHKIYGSFAAFQAYCRAYNIHVRLGYASPESCWKKNPTVGGSTNPADLCVIKKKDRLSKKND